MIKQKWYRNILMVIGIFFYSISFAFDKTELQLVYDRFYIKIEKKLKDQNTIITQLEALDKKISLAVNKTKNSQKIKLLTQLQEMNTSKIHLLKIAKIKQNIEQAAFSNTPFIQELTKVGYKTLLLNDNYEYKENAATYRFHFKKYYKLDASAYEYFIKNKLQNAYIIKYKGDFILTNDFEIEKKYTYDELYGLFKNKVDYKSSYSLENNEYFSYKYNYYVFFEKNDGVYLSDLEANNININTTLIAKDRDGKYFFSNDYKKIRLVGKNLVSGISNQEEFFYNILDDNRNIEGNYDETLLYLRSITLDLIKNTTTQEEKIKAIYKWVIDNIEYYKDFTDGNKQVFSGVHTFKNRTGVCDGYTKTFSYMLSFAGIHDVEIKRGYAFDSQDFPTFGHAWVRIGDYYYDPTFDDPVGNTDSDKQTFLYYKLPYDLMYTNRFDGIDIPTNLQGLSLEKRKQIALKNMYDIYNRYKDFGIMSKIKNRLSLGIAYDEKINLATLTQKVDFYEVKDFVFYDKTGKKYSIAGLNYYLLLDDARLETILFDTKIDLTQAQFFIWNTADGKKEYRLAYNLKYR